MPLSPEMEATAEALTALYRKAQANLTARLAEIMGDDNRRRQQTRLREQIRTVDAIADGLEEGTRGWITDNLPALHEAGARAGATAAGTEFAWTAPHAEAVQQLATNVWTDVAENLSGMRAQTKRKLRELAADAAREQIVEGRTASASARLLERWMVDNGIGTVTYRNGAQHLAADYADTLARTVTANAYNEGTFTQADVDGFGWMEVFDGGGCGWTSHDDGDLANGTVRSLQDCRDHPLSHPRCARSFSPRPDVASQAAADAAKRFTGMEQAAMAADEALRDARASTTLIGRARSTTAARAARTARVARKARKL